MPAKGERLTCFDALAPSEDVVDNQLPTEWTDVQLVQLAPSLADGS